MDASPLCALGHLATRRDLETSGLSRRQIDALARLDTVVRVRKGVYACRHLTEPERIAAATGARLDCITVLRRNQIWAGHEQGLHLRMPSNASAPARERLNMVVRAFARAGYRVLGSAKISVHWSRCAAAEMGVRLEVPVFDALSMAMTCLPPDDAVAALESALHLRHITASELDQLIVAAPKRLQQALTQVTPGAQSGYETKARLKLKRLGHTVEIQAPVPGVGHVDMVIDGVVALEIDGRETHADAFESDRDRDLGTEACGVRCLRVPAVWVDTRWDDILVAIDRMIKDARLARDRAVRRMSRKRRRTEAEIFDDTPSPQQ